MINIKMITEGKLDGEVVWVCDYRFKNGLDKPIRAIKPTKVMIMSNDCIKKRVYYSSSHFQCLNKEGNPLKSKVIVPFDNTGYRSYSGVPLNCFRTEKECREFFKSQLEEAKILLENYKISVIADINVKIRDIDSLE